MSILILINHPFGINSTEELKDQDLVAIILCDEEIENE